MNSNRPLRLLHPRFLAVFLLPASLLIFGACVAPQADASDASADEGSDRIVAESDPALAEIDPSLWDEDHWRRTLTPEEFRILRRKGTERAFTGEFWNHKEHGVYTCGGCGLPLFESDTKFRSGTGWPSFWQPIAEEAVDVEADNSYGMRRTEILCARCGGHLGHVFNDGPRPTGLRYCVNSLSLDFEPHDDEAAQENGQ